MALQIFSEYNDIIAGFSTKPETGKDLRDMMAKEQEKKGKYLIRALLVHGKNIFCVKKDILKSSSYLEIEDTDGLVTDIPGVRLTTTHGDCIPIYAFDPNKKVVGLAHAGWKGTSMGIAYSLIDTMKNEYGSNPEEIVTYIGPGIGKCHFEFGRDDAEKYFFINEWTKEFSTDHINPSKVYLDLKGINKRFLENAGVKNVEVNPDCTCCMDKKYYSYRRAKETERMLAYIEALAPYVEQSKMR